MPHPLMGWMMSALLGLCVIPAALHTEQDDDAATLQHIEQLKNIRGGLVDLQARPEDRRRWAELLFSYNTTNARALIVELLRASDRPDVQRALCAVLAARARANPDRLDASFVDPLIDLLGADANDLRASAAAALAEFPGTDVPKSLGALASQPNLSMAKRLAAIDALAPNTQRREVVHQLIALLEAEAPEIHDRAIQALEATLPVRYGGDTQKWRDWWAGQEKLSEEEWLVKRLQFFRDRMRATTDEFREYREGSARDQAAVTARVRTFQRELFRSLPAEQRSARLAEWMNDSLPVVRLGALAIIKTRMADEGKRPEGDVLKSLLALLREGSPEMRREVLDVVQNLNNPGTVEAVLAQLDRETDPAMRHAFFKAIGKLDHPDALPALIREIASAQSAPDCVREAAIALGSVAAKVDLGERRAAVTSALKGRFGTVPPDRVALRAALLSAMAGVADDSFQSEFLEALDSDEPTILRPAIRGTSAIADSTKLARLRTLTGHADPLVRLEAIDAVGKLGREEADLENLLARLNPSVEPNDAGRDAAWRGVCQLLDDRTLPERIKATERLRDLPALEIRYLTELADELSAAPNERAEEYAAVLDRLTLVLRSQGRDSEAIPYLRTLYELQTARDPSAGRKIRLRLLAAMLRSADPSEVTAWIRKLPPTAPNEEAGDDSAATAVNTVRDYLASDEFLSDLERANALVNELHSIPNAVVGDGWTAMLDQAAQRLASEPPKPAPAPTESNGTSEGPNSSGTP